MGLHLTQCSNLWFPLAPLSASKLPGNHFFHFFFFFFAQLPFDSFQLLSQVSVTTGRAATLSSATAASFSYSSGISSQNRWEMFSRQPVLDRAPRGSPPCRVETRTCPEGGPTSWLHTGCKTLWKSCMQTSGSHRLSGLHSPDHSLVSWFPSDLLLELMLI